MQTRSPDFEIQITAAATDHFTEPFTAPDKLALMVLCENTTGSGSVTVTPQHSNDGGRNWIDKTALTLSPSSTISAGAVSPIFGADDGATPNMSLMRIKLRTATVTPNIKGYINSRTY